MASLINTISLIAKLWLLKYWFYLILYVACLVAAVLAIRSVKEPIIPMLLLVYANWILFVLSGADKKLVQNNYYRVMNVPADYVLFAKALLLFLMAGAQALVLAISYPLDFSVLIFCIFFASYALFHLERVKLHWLVRMLLQIIGLLVVIPLVIALLLTAIENVYAALAGLFIIIVVGETFAVVHGKYHRV
jgi:hypothetical protein